MRTFNSVFRKGSRSTPERDGSVRKLFFGAFAGLLLLASPSFGFVHEFRRSLAEEALSETVPFTFSPNEFTASDFSVSAGSLPEGIRASLGRESFEWVRVSEVFLLPRGRLIVEVEPAWGKLEAGRLRNYGLVQPLSRDEQGRWRAEIPLVLLSESSNVVHVELLSDGKLVSFPVRVRFTPREEVLSQRVLVDPSCSPADVRLSARELPRNQFVYVGCRTVVGMGDTHPVSVLEAYAYWEGVAEDRVLVAGMVTPPKLPQVWGFRLESAPGSFPLRESGGNAELELSYRIPRRLRFGSLGMGLGPYSYAYDAPGVAPGAQVVPLVTFYASYFFSEVFRFSAFNATAPVKNGFSDTGFYLVSEQFNVFDRRYFMRVLLGLNGVAYPVRDQVRFSFGGPQGFELTVTDFAGRRRNLAVGAFIYPLIDRREYYNIWVRWGSPSLFGELNFISWQYPLGEVEADGRAYMRSLGVTVGMPLGRFL
jgi:hypothetical protein